MKDIFSHKIDTPDGLHVDVLKSDAQPHKPQDAAQPTETVDEYFERVSKEANGEA